MSDWVIFPWNVYGLIAAFVFFALAVNLLFIKGKSTFTWLLIAMLVFLGYQLALPQMLNIAANSDWQHWAFRPKASKMVESTLAVIAYPLVTAFMYRVGSIRFRSEERIVMLLALIMAMLSIGLTLGGVIESPTAPAFRAIGQVWNLWFVIVLIRKWRRTDRFDERSRSAYRAFAYLIIAAVVANILVWALQGLGLGYAREVAVEVFSAVIPIAFALVFLQFVPEATSMEVKFVAVGFMAVMVLTQLHALPSNRPQELRFLYAPTLEPSSITLAPTSERGYRAEGRPFVYHAPLGDTLGTTDELFTPVKPAFPMMAFGLERDSVYVSPNGKVLFEAPPDTARGYRRLHDLSVPAVAPLDLDLDPSEGGSVTAWSTPDSLMVTWHQVPRFWDEDSGSGLFEAEGRRFSAQVVLRRDGTMTITRGLAPFRPLYWGHGIMIGLNEDTSLSDGAAPDTILGRLVAAHFPVVSGPGQSLYYAENNVPRYEAWSRGETFRILQNAFFGFLLVLLVVPLYFRLSIKRRLLRLLGGLDRVNQGDLEQDVPISINDEVGQLSGAFNEMTESLRSYAHNMEDLVEARTAELKATQAQLIEQEKLASLGSLTAGIAHEIKNPLNFVNNFAEVGGELADELAEAIAAGNTEEAQQILNELKANATQIAKHGKRADSIVQGMMQHARGGASDMESVVVNDFLEEYANLAWHGRRARDHGFQTEIRKDFDPETGSIEVMPQELGRVVLNLLNNAFDAVKAQDDVVVTVATERTEESVIIRVSDNGPGIPEDIRQKIFEPFFTTKATGEGTGLGLSLSYDIVTKGHGGSMTVGESPDGGALFTITIPVDRS